eukprot:1598528-Rhodomonas_salina.1
MQRSAGTENSALECRQIRVLKSLRWVAFATKQSQHRAMSNDPKLQGKADAPAQRFELKRCKEEG